MSRHTHHYRSPYKRALFSFLLVAAVMVVGTWGLHQIEGVSWIKAFYFMSMIATAQGPLFTPVTNTGLIFTSLMAFVSVGTVVAALGFLLGPFFGLLWRIGLEKFEGELRLIKKEK